MPNIYTYVKINVHDGASANIRKLKFEYLQLHICVYVHVHLCVWACIHIQIFSSEFILRNAYPMKYNRDCDKLQGLHADMSASLSGRWAVNQPASAPVSQFGPITVQHCTLGRRGAQCWVCGLSTTTLTTSGRKLQLIVWQINLKQEPHLTTIQKCCNLCREYAWNFDFMFGDYTFFIFKML